MDAYILQILLITGFDPFPYVFGATLGDNASKQSYQRLDHCSPLVRSHSGSGRGDKAQSHGLADKPEMKPNGKGLFSLPMPGNRQGSWHNMCARRCFASLLSCPRCNSQCRSVSLYPPCTVYPLDFITQLATYVPHARSD